MVLLDLPRWTIESSTILLARTVCGDETTLEVGDRLVPGDARGTMAERHPNQVASMVESRVGTQVDRDE